MMAYVRNSSLREVLTSVHESGGEFSWPESVPCPLGPMAEVAEFEGYLIYTAGAAQGAFEGYKLSRKAREYLDLPPTIGDRISVSILKFCDRLLNTILPPRA